MSENVNVARRLDDFAKSRPHAVAVAAARAKVQKGKPRYDVVSFAKLAAESDRISRGLLAWGVEPGMRLALLVKPGVDFITLVFALLKAGVVQILIDPGMGRSNLIRCLEESKPDGFVALPVVQVIRRVLRHKFPAAKWNVSVGRRPWLCDGRTLDEIRVMGDRDADLDAMETRTAEDPAAVIFTTGSTGAPKGVLYSHGNFDHQVEQIRDRYGIAPGEVNLACFPLFGLFNAAMGVTTVVPDMDASRPAKVDPKNIVRAVMDWSATQSFASPAVWNRVSSFCETHRVKLPTLREAYSAGAPVPPEVLERTLACLADGARMHTPYGATEALPVATIEAREVLDETQHAWARGKGTCVGSRFPGIEWKVVKIVDGPICTIDRAQELPIGEVGELIVRGPVVTSRYVTRVEANATAKIHDGPGYWHRMGDAGYLDERGRFWFCGRTAHRVQTEQGTLFTDPVEGVFNQHPLVVRTALVGIGVPGMQVPVLVYELRNARINPGPGAVAADLLKMAASNALTSQIKVALWHPSFPVDIRHNSKIFREQLAVWAAKRLQGRRG